MAEQKTEIKLLFQSRFWRSSLPRSWYKWSAMMLFWALRWDIWLPRAGKEPRGARLSLLNPSSGSSRASCWDFASTSPLIASFLPSSDKLKSNLPLLLTRWGWPSIQPRAGSSVRNPKTMGLASAPICRQSTLLSVPPYPVSHVQALHPPDPLTTPLSACLQVSLF